MGESSIASARASVMIYDDVNKKWIPSGSSSGLSKVHIYQHLTNNTFRVVGRKLQDTNEVVINCAILKGLKYNQATSTFHQWRDNRQVYGLNFSSREDADRFADAMLRVLDTLVNSSTGTLPSARSQQQQQQQQQVMYGHIGPPVNNEYLEINQVMRQQQQQAPMGNGWPSNEQNEAVRMHQQQMQAVQEREMNMNMMNSMHPPPPPAAPQLPPQIPQQNQQQMLQHRSPPTNTGTGMMPQNPVVGIQPAIQYQMPQQVQAPPMSSAPPPPPPPPPPGALFGTPNPPPFPSGNCINNPMTGTAGRSPASTVQSSSSSQPPAMSNLASAIANAKLKKTPGKDSDRDSTGSGGGGSTGGGSSAPTGGMASMMDEMAKTLARRRAQAEGGESKVDGNKSITNGCSPNKDESRFRSGSTDGAQVNGMVESFDVEKLKQEILTEIRKELQRTKMEIIEAIRVELNRR